MKRPLYQHIASRVQAMVTCEQTGNTEWHAKHLAAIQWLVKEHMPSGSGIDTGTHYWESDKQTPDKLIFSFSYHHMAESGMYDGWTEHQVIVTPSLTHGIELRITGRDRNDIKEYLYQVFEQALTAEIEDANEKLKDAVTAA